MLYHSLDTGNRKTFKIGKEVYDTMREGLRTRLIFKIKCQSITRQQQKRRKTVIITDNLVDFNRVSGVGGVSRS